MGAKFSDAKTLLFDDFMTKHIIPKSMVDRKFIALNIVVLTISDTRDEATDKSGQLLVKRIQSAGHHYVEKRIVPDDIALIRNELSAWIEDETADVVLTTGGTGLTGRDNTPEAAIALFDKKIDGFGEMFRALSYETIGTSTLQSRAVAGVANGTFIFVYQVPQGLVRTLGTN